MTDDESSASDSTERLARCYTGVVYDMLRERGHTQCVLPPSIVPLDLGDGRGRPGLDGARRARRERDAAREPAALDRASCEARAAGHVAMVQGHDDRARADGRALGRDAAVPRRARLHRRRRLPRHRVHPPDRLSGLLRQGDAARHRRRLGAGRLRRADQLRAGGRAARRLRACRLRRHRRDPAGDVPPR